MKIPFQIFFALLALSTLAALPAFAATAPDIAEPAQWVATLASPQITDTPEADKTYGLDYLFVDQQINVREQATYGRVIYRITNAVGGLTGSTGK